MTKVKFQDNPLDLLYLQEIFLLSNNIVNLCNEIDDILPSKNELPEKGGLLIIKPEVFTKLTSIIVLSANIKKILVTAPRKKKESREAYLYRKNRVALISAFFSINRISETFKVQARNSIEHYDERLDKVAYKIENNTLSNTYHVVTSNIIFSNKNLISGDLYYVKCYIMDTKTFRNDGVEAKIGEIYKEALLLLSESKKALGDNDPGGGVMIPLKY